MNKVLVDFYRLKDIHSGLGYFSKQLSRFLLKNNTNAQLTFLVPKSFVEVYDKLCYTKSFTHIQRIFSCCTRSYDLWHSTSQFPRALPPRKKTKFILTIHDLNFLYEKSYKKQKKYIRRLQKLVNRADAITAISYFTKSNIEQNLNLQGKKVDVIYNGVDSPELTKPQKPNWIENNPFFFSIGLFTKKKNWESIIAMMTEFPNYKLVISGYNDTSYGTFCKQLIKENSIENRVILSGSVSNEEKSWLFANCTAFLFPSKAEGFGMPAVEAMKMGKPTFLSNHTSLPEIGGDAAFFFDSFEKSHMKSIVESGLDLVKKNPKKFSEKTQQHAQKFNWQTAAKQYLALYDKLLS